MLPKSEGTFKFRNSQEDLKGGGVGVGVFVENVKGVKFYIQTILNRVKLGKNYYGKLLVILKLEQFLLH